MKPKARESTSDIAILGVLALQEGLSGYDIRQFIEASISHFWGESFGQIYPVLARLTRQKLVKSASDKASARGRKTYFITPAGRQKLQDWLTESPQPERPRSELLLKVFFGSQGPVDTVIGHLESLAQRSSAQAVGLREVERVIRQQDAGSPTLLYSIATIRAGVRLAEARAQWAHETIDLIRKGHV